MNDKFGCLIRHSAIENKVTNGFNSPRTFEIPGNRSRVYSTVTESYTFLVKVASSVMLICADEKQRH